MLLYNIVRPFARLSFYAFYRKIILTNTDRIPKGKPVILAANHPTAFLEPCILACFLDRPLNFLVRGDLFVKPVYNKLLRGLNLLPVFRLKDGGYGKLKNNYSTFEACFEALANNKTIMILAEGSTIQEKRLRPLQKGTARIALGAMEQMPELGEIYVVPVGVNFTYADKPRTEVMIDFGEPMLTSEYWAEYEQNTNQGISKMTAELREHLLEHLVIIDEKEDDELVEHLHRIYRTEQNWSSPPLISKSETLLETEIKIGAKVNELEQDKKEDLKALAAGYFEHLQQFGLDDRALMGKDFSKLTVLFQLILGFPFQLIGKLWNYLPAFIGKYISDTKVKTLEFKAPVRWGASLGAFLVYMPIWFLIAAVSGRWEILGGSVVLLLLGYYHLYYQELKYRYLKSKRLKEVPAKQVEKLKEKRREVIKTFGFKR